MIALGPTRRLRSGLICLLCIAVRSSATVDEANPQNTETTPTPVAVVQQTSVPPKLQDDYLETGGSYETLDHGFGHWDGGYARGVYKGSRNIWNAEVNGQHEFGDAGTYFAAGDTVSLSPDWYGALTVGSSVQGFFWPRFRVDSFLNKKWLRGRQWITTAGYGFYEAKDVHHNHYLYLGSTYYFAKPWIVEEGMYFNLSNPGTVFAPGGFVAVTQGRNRHQYITVRAGLGEEGYQLVGPTVILTQFQSQTLNITWRKWLGPNWGLNFAADYYHNPFYTRGGSSFGVFKEF
jgi:YaiO family outer membrane protein